MKTKQYIGILLLIGLVSCGEEELLPEDLLIGSWSLKSSSTDIPSIDFNANGKYKRVEYFDFPVGNFQSKKLETILEGEYSFRNDTIGFETAHIDFLDTLFSPSSTIDINTIEGNSIAEILNQWNPEQGTNFNDLHSMPDTAYTPVKWKVTSLTGNELTVITNINSILVYEKEANLP